MAATKKPNILILWGDDIGIWNISHFSRGMMGYRTPNIDRIAQEGVTFTDYYGQQSCTAGRACFITGQNPIRTGLTKVGMPGATVGLQAEDPTIAELLKPLGYATGQFGKNHLGDRDEYLPTVHGFDEFFGNLYHLNAEEEPELPDYPKDPAFKKKFGPRGVLHCIADGKGGQTIKDTGPLTKKRMETIDEEITDERARLDGEAGQGRQAVLPLVQLDGDALPHARRREEPRQERAGRLQRSHGRARRADRRDARQARRARHRRQHHRHVLDRQRPGERHLAGWRQHAVPRPEGHQLGGRLARAVLHALAGQDQAGHGAERHRLAQRHAPDAARDRRRSGRQPEAAQGLQGRRQDLQGAPRRLQPAALPDRRGEGEPAKHVLLHQRRRRRHGGALGDYKFVLAEQRAQPRCGSGRSRS